MRQNRLTRRSFIPITSAKQTRRI